MATIYLGILLTALVLYIFLHSFKVTLIIGISMPITLVSTFLLADYAGLTHEEAAEEMQISRSTFSRLIEQSRKKIADFIIFLTFH